MKKKRLPEFPLPLFGVTVGFFKQKFTQSVFYSIPHPQLALEDTEACTGNAITA